MIKGFSDFFLKAPECHPGVPFYRAHFKLDIDVSSLFPYVNAVAKDAQYYDSPHFIKFPLNNIGYAMYPNEIIIVPVENREQALDFFDKLRDYLNDIDARKNNIEPDFNAYKHISVLDIYKRLPKTNCKECGYTTCMAFADALSKRDIGPEKCPEYKLGT